MLNLIKKLKEMDSKIKWFYFNTYLYILLMIISTMFAYGRLNYDRSYAESKIEAEKLIKKAENL